MKRIVYVLWTMFAFVVSCNDEDALDNRGENVVGEGVMSVLLQVDAPCVKALSDYDVVLGGESKVESLEVLVFDRISGRLERSAMLSSINDECVFELPVGAKIVYAVVNGPDLGGVHMVDDLLHLVDELAGRNLMQSGFTRVGSAECEVKSAVVAKPQVNVARLVSRVVLRSVKCNLARQYEKMTLDCAFLGNAYVCQTLGGTVSVMANIDGYQDAGKTLPIGLDDTLGKYPENLYRSIGSDVYSGQTFSSPVYLYCQPNQTDDYTCLYLLVTIDGHQYYYRVPLDKGLKANVSCAVDAVITNLGAPLPPDGVIQKGEIRATVVIEDWYVGNLYNAEF